MGALLGSAPDVIRFGSRENAGPGVLAMTFDASSNLYVAIYNGYSGSGVQFINIQGGGAPHPTPAEAG